ncbi:hypothetical protein AB1Y20_023321 [Prymnesium parvum]|uniref:Uncharacterized protein n=1 Tax=Prymnesium parvum TaxID=97485 RepID=A0AB34JDQ5_PRYPA
MWPLLLLLLPAHLAALGGLDTLRRRMDATPQPSAPPEQALLSSKARAQEPCLQIDDVPPPTTRCSPRRQPLVILSGEGKTATESVSSALAMLGLKVSHFKSYIQCCDINFFNRSVGNATLFGIDTGVPKPGANPYCTTLPRYANKTCQGIVWSDLHPLSTSLYERVNQLPTTEYDTFDWCIYDDVDVVADVPIPFVAPYIYNAYGPGTKVINTVRKVSKWPQRRAEWDAEFNVHDSAPFGWMFSESIEAASRRESPTSATGMYNRSRTAAVYGYIAEISLIRCTVHPDDFLEINLVDDEWDPPHVWHRLATFLNRTTEGLDITRFPHEVPPRCHSQNVRATYPPYDMITTTAPDTPPQGIMYFPESLNFFTALQGCGSSGSTFLDELSSNWTRILLKAAGVVSLQLSPGCAHEKNSTITCLAQAFSIAGKLLDSLGLFEKSLRNGLSSTSLVKAVEAAGELPTATLVLIVTLLTQQVASALA